MFSTCNKNVLLYFILQNECEAQETKIVRLGMVLQTFSPIAPIFQIGPKISPI